MLPIEEIPNENYHEEKRRQREKNSAKYVPSQHPQKMRRYEEIIYEVVLAANRIGSFDINGKFVEMREIEIRQVDYQGSLMDFLQKYYLLNEWGLRNNLPGASPASRTVFNNNTIKTAVLTNRSYLMSHREVLIKTVTVKLINVREITEQ